MECFPALASENLADYFVAVLPHLNERQRWLAPRAENRRWAAGQRPGTTSAVVSGRYDVY
jgi:hypothetical protein